MNKESVLDDLEKISLIFSQLDQENFLKNEELGVTCSKVKKKLFENGINGHRISYIVQNFTEKLISDSLNKKGEHKFNKTIKVLTGLLFWDKFLENSEEEIKRQNNMIKDQLKDL